ncbi:MAG: T9SS type B sorting domain-containing protein [Flavobacteriales bacterium]
MSRYIAGPDTGVQVTRFDAWGAALWHYSFTDPGVPFLQPDAICLANDSGYLIGGQTAGYTNKWDPFILKLDAAGALVWFKTYTCNRNLYVNDISQDVNGNICMVGADYFLYTSFWTSQWNTFFVPTENAAVVLITDNAGAPVSFKPYSFHFGGVDRKWEHFSDVEPLSGGGFLIAGNSGHNWDFFAGTALRVDGVGNQLWCRNWLCTQFGGAWSSDVMQCAVQDGPGTALLAGYVSDHDQYGGSWSYRDMHATKIDLATGNFTWSARYASTAANVSDGTLVNGRFLVTGYKYSYGYTPVGGLLYDVDASSGALNQLRTFMYDPAPGTSFGTIDKYANGDLLFGGTTNRNGFSQAMIQKTDPFGGGACTDSLWTAPTEIPLVWNEQLMTINDAGGQNPSPVTSISAVAVDRSLTRTCVCLKASSFCPTASDTLFVLNKDTLACASDSLNIASFLNDPMQCNVPMFTYDWTYYSNGSVVGNAVIGGSQFAAFSGSTPLPIAAPAGANSIQVQLEVLDCAGDTVCVVAASVGIGGGQLTNNVLGPDTTFCGAGFLLGPGSADSTATFAWYAGNIGSTLQQAQAGGTVGTGPYYTADSSGTYFLSVTVDGCTSLDSASVDMDLLNLDLLDSAWFCAGDTALLDAAWPGATAYAWSGVAVGNLVTAPVSVQGYAIVSVMVGNCAGADTIVVSEQPLPSLDLPDSLPLCIDVRSAFLEITDPHDSAMWSTGETTSSVEPEMNGYYSAIIFENGCTSLPDSTLLYWDDCSCTLFLPNSFTPDGDGINDNWGPVMDCPLRSMELLLFDRWGEVIAALHTPAERWDGMYGGQSCPIGVYPYKLRYASDRMDTGNIERVERAGHVSLVR